MKDGNLNIFKDAYGKKFKFYNENTLMLQWYSSRLIERLGNDNCESCLSLGIGHKVVSRAIVEGLKSHLKRYIIVEGAQDIIDEYKREVKLPHNYSLVCALFEEFDAGEKFDAIEMGFVLEHVEDPLSLMKRYAGFLKPEGSVYIAVPNAGSLHRLVGVKAGMLDDIYRLGEHDLSLGHKRYFDKQSLVELIAKSGLRIKNIEGIFLKPFSTFQLESLKLPLEVLEALCSLAVGYPEISNALFVEARL